MMVQLGLLLQAGQHIKVLTDALSEGTQLFPTVKHRININGRLLLFCLQIRRSRCR